MHLVCLGHESRYVRQSLLAKSQNSCQQMLKLLCNEPLGGVSCFALRSAWCTFFLSIQSNRETPAADIVFRRCFVSLSIISSDAINANSGRVVYKGKKIVVVMPAYNAARTLRQTHAEILEEDFVDLVIVVDDGSCDETTKIALSLSKTQVHTHPQNMGYGANQKTCYGSALSAGADIIVMIHADYQYTPKLLPAMVAIIANDVHKIVLGSRILGGYALAGGMPIWKYVGNRFLTAVENLLLGSKLSEFHTGYRAFAREVLDKTPWQHNSNDFVFDNEIIAESLWAGYSIGEVSCPTKYFDEASSINLIRSVKYGVGCLRVGVSFRLARWGLVSHWMFPTVRR